MPVTRFSEPPQRHVAVPDYPEAIAKLDRLGYDAADPRRTAAIAVVRRARTPSSLKAMAWIVIRTLSWFNARGINVLEASPLDAKEWWNSLARYAPGTRDAYLQCLRMYYAEAVDLDLTGRDPTRRIDFERQEPMTPTPALTRSQAQTLIRIIDDEVADETRSAIATRDAALVGVLLRMCLRETETQNLVWGNIELSEGATVMTFIGKGRKPATLRIPADLLTRLEAWRAVQEETFGRSVGPPDPVFTSFSPRALRRGRSPRKPLLVPLARSEIFCVVRDRLAQIGVVGPRMGPHALRATGATLAYEGGADLIACQGLLRHSSIETTRRFYIKRTEDKANEAIDRMGLG
jgi:integrase/recombinase XerC